MIVRVSPATVTARFLSYHALSLTEFQKPRCAAAGVTWPSRGISLEIPSYYQPNTGKSVKRSEVSVKQINPQTVQVTAPTAALGPALRASDSWRAYGAGPTCPPMAVEIEFLPASGTARP